jgi:hypothetical protein
MQRNFSVSAFSSFNNSKAIDVRDAVYTKSPVKATTHSVTKVTTTTVTKQIASQDVVKKKRKKAETGALSVEVLTLSLYRSDMC